VKQIDAIPAPPFKSFDPESSFALPSSLYLARRGANPQSTSRLRCGSNEKCLT
jgi:hypothetical protein